MAYTNIVCVNKVSLFNQGITNTFSIKYINQMKKEGMNFSEKKEG